METGFSDHLAQIITLNILNPATNSCNTKIKRIYNQPNFEKFTASLNTVNWNHLTQNSDVNSQMANFLSEITKKFDLCFPKKVVKDKNHMVSNWFTKGLKVSRRKKIWLNEIRKCDSSGVINEFFTKYNKIYKKLIRAAKIKANTNKITAAKNKSKMAWQIIKNETKVTPHDNALTIIHRHTTVHDPSLVANLFNDLFIDIAADLVSGLSPPNHNPYFYDYQPLDHDELVLYPCTETELADIIKSRRNSFTSGPDELPDLIMKQSSNLFSSPLLKIINNSLSYGTFPNILKTAKVHPCHKKGPKTNLQNYRPISQLSFFSKIYEAVMVNRLVGFIEAYNIISPAQHGFVKNKSTSTALNSLYWKIIADLEKGLSVSILSLDQSRAFDCVNHEIMLTKLHSIGVRGVALRWFKSYLADRSQRVHINKGDGRSYTSKLSKLHLGLAQGSLLAPILFLIYINDLPKIVNPEICFGFADDFNLVLSLSKDKHNENELAQHLFNLERWFNCNKLVLNLDKTVLINVKNNSNLFQIFNRDILNCKNSKLLGVTFDENLNWADHILNVKKRLNSNIFLLRTLKNKIDNDCQLLVYYANIHSILSYGITLWGQGTNWKDVFICQKKAVRILNGKEYDNEGHPITCRPIFKKLGILTFPSVYILECIKFIEKHGNMLDKFASLHSHDTRYKENFCLTAHSRRPIERSVYYAGSLFINKISRIKNINSIRNFLTENAFYSVEEFLNFKSP